MAVAKVKRWIVVLVTLGFICLSRQAGFAENSWKIQINIPEFKLFLYQGADLHRIYPVAIGKPASPSPLGEFKIVNKVVNPTWYPPDHGKPVPPGPHNPLGRFWLGLSLPGYGIHGNAAPLSIGSSASLGCFRMRNQDVAELFQIVPTETPVQIVYETIRTNLTDGRLFLEVFPDIYHLVEPEEAVDLAIQGSAWPYQPHRAALETLLRGAKPLKLEVPRRIEVASAQPDADGFFWNGEPYVNRRILTELPATIHIWEENASAPFQDYLPASQLRALGDDILTIDWDESLNLLTIDSLIR